ncbi:hypothetical protein KQI76_07390 [Amphibacillus sp. MSJ-3]|uniref:hypothetical protein n=1 Tax=Amphibacillus sp. MSJ-3 TaxID=2841505 RepID=UPI001C0EBB62|nr:hypothetical protein [Amphibacillus sp. MSJ-3]MBU5594986.1 hypothetical protein [Amphibacillus sp. MSJ-3]
MIYLILISFLIHVITLVMIKQLKEKLNQPREDKEVLAQQQKQIEDLLAVYLLEIREENEKLIDIINRSHQETSSHLETEDRPIEAELDLTADKYQDYQPIVPDDREDIIEQSFVAQVLSLYEKGDTPEVIAKKLNRGKTEIELLIKFHQSKKK